MRSRETSQIRLDTTEEELRQTFMQTGGEVTAADLLIDNGSYDIRGGTLTVGCLAMGDPTSDRIQAENFVGYVAIQADDPVTVSRLDFRSRAGAARYV